MFLCIKFDWRIQKEVIPSLPPTPLPLNINKHALFQKFSPQSPFHVLLPFEKFLDPCLSMGYEIHSI